MTDVQEVLAQEVQSNPVVSTPQDTQPPKFTDYPFAESVLRDITAAGYVHPTPIQAACIVPALEGKDLIGLAQTGTGKTAAFALPIIQKLAQCTELAALVLTPTRELAMQVTGVFNALGQSSGMRVATIVGGIPMDNDYKALRSWPNVLVATPGRLIDHLTYGSVSLKEIRTLVVDEADRMHDMGFIPQIRRILDELPSARQTLMFTATMPKDVERIARMSMNNPERIQVGRQVPVEGAKQQLFRVHDEEKGSLLMNLLSDSENAGRVLVFVRTKRGCDKLHRIVCRRFNAARIHGDREQVDRDDAMNGFRDGRYRILIATDIAARGIDVADIEHVINYDFPLSAEDYVHRIGRTARAQATGLATSFVTPNDRRFLLDAHKLLGDRLPLTDDLKDMLAGRHSRHGRGHGHSDNGRNGNGRHHGEPPRGPQPEAEVVRHHHSDSTTDQARDGGSRRRGRRGRGRGHRPAGDNQVSVQTAQESAPLRQPHQSHQGGRQPHQSHQGDRQPRQIPQGERHQEQPAAAAPTSSRKEQPAATPPRKRRRSSSADEGYVVILDRCDDGPDGIVGEEEDRRRRHRARRPQGRRSGRKPKADQSQASGADSSQAAQ